MSHGIFGGRVRRIEDPALLRGTAIYVDDIRLPDMLHAVFVRSPHAHALVTSIDTAMACSAPGVHDVWTFAEIARHCADPAMPPGPVSTVMRHKTPTYPLVMEEVCHVGEPVAVVFADSRYLAEDAAALVEVGYETLPVANNCRVSATDTAPRTWRGLPDNRLCDFNVAYGDCDTAFVAAAHVFADCFLQHKGLAHSLEGRGLVARFDSNQERLTVWTSTQSPHLTARKLQAMLGLHDHQLRLITPEVGGGFGPKYLFYPEDVIIPLAARVLRRPVKWIEDRREHFTSTAQERDQYWDLQLAMDDDARILGLRGTFTHDHGAYNIGGINLPYNAATCMPGPYVVPSYDLRVLVVLTNRIPASPVRGAGRPQAAFAIERLMDRAAQALGIDRAEIRLRNVIPPERMPYTLPLRSRDGATITYDSGDYVATLRTVMEASDYAGFPARQARARAEGRYRGIGIANFVEGTGRGPFESAIVRIGPSGKIMVFTGASAQGQGTRTTLAQICAEQFGASLDDVTVISGDTATIPLGQGAFASRQAVTAGSSVHVAAVVVREKAIGIAAHMLETAKEDLDIADGRVFVKGVPDVSVTLGQVANAVAGTPGYALPPGMSPGLEASANWLAEAITHCNGAAVVEVEVDPETGQVRILRFVAVHDSGRLINPLIVDGQIIGGTVHGIGSALLERMVYDDAGQPQTVTLAEYLMPGAVETPNVEVVHRETPSPLNPIGVKGAGEGGTIPTPAAIVAAVEDALSPFGVRISETPITPDRIVALVAAACDGHDKGAAREAHAMWRGTGDV